MSRSDNAENTRLYHILGWIVSILVPIALVLSAVRLLITPAYVRFEYAMPGFPEDRYGFTLEDRLRWSRPSVEYLTNDEGISFLAELRFDEGETVPMPSCEYMEDCTLIYNERELSHMVDVKNVVGVAMRIWVASLIGLLVLGIWAWRAEWWSDYRRAVGRGGWLTVLLLGAIILFVLIAFGAIFVLFHQIFFESGTWTFFYSDTLIRLFPERFWRDTFLWVGVLAGGPGLLLWYLSRRDQNNPI